MTLRRFQVYIEGVVFGDGKPDELERQRKLIERLCLPRLNGRVNYRDYTPIVIAEDLNNPDPDGELYDARPRRKDYKGGPTESRKRWLKKKRGEQ